MAALSSDPVTPFTFHGSDSVKEAVVDSQDSLVSRQDSIAPVFQAQEATVPHTQSTDASANSTEQSAADPATTTNNPQPQSASMLRTKSSPGPSNTVANSTPLNESVVKSFLSTPGYLANRWNPANNSSSTPVSAQSNPLVTPPM